MASCGKSAKRGSERKRICLRGHFKGKLIICHDYLYRHYFQSHNIVILWSSLSFFVAQNTKKVLDKMKAAAIMKGAYIKDIFISGKKSFVQKHKIL